ncbi:MAG: hypothetical protein ACI4CT_03585 [Lachnospiraceae bacterium]
MKSTIKWQYRCYDFLSQWFVTRRMVQKLLLEYQLLMPNDLAEAKRKTLYQVLKVVCVMSGVTVLFLSQQMDVFIICMMLALLFILFQQLWYRTLEREEQGLLKELEEFLSDIRHEYFVHHMVDEAVYMATQRAGKRMSLHGEAIYEALIHPDMEGAVAHYEAMAPNAFLKTFIAICLTTIQFGDKIVEEQSLFLMNIQNLKQEVAIELLKRERIQYAFSGFVCVAVAPMCCLKWIAHWGITNLPELAAFYYGTAGSVLFILIVVITLIAYEMIIALREQVVIRKKDYPLLEWMESKWGIKKALEILLHRNYGRTLRIRDCLKKTGSSMTVSQFILQRCLTGLLMGILTWILALTIHSQNRTRLLCDTGYIQQIATGITSAEQKKAEEFVLSYMQELKRSKTDGEYLAGQMLEQGVVSQKETAGILGDAMADRLYRYNREYFKWYELVIILFVMVIGYYLPWFLLVYRRKILQMRMDDEVIQFQSVILMLVYLEQIGTDTILQWMERFAAIFYASLEKCINNYSASDTKALQQLKEDEPYEPFVRIVENLEMADQIGVQKAFEEIVADRNQFQEKRKQENDIYVHKKSVWGRIVAYIPMILTIGCYLIIPFMVESIGQLLNYMQQMQQM